MASNPPSTLKPDGIDYEDLFGYNDYAFPIKLPELPNDMSFNNFSYFEWIQRYAELNVESSNFSQETTNSVYDKVVQLKCQSQGLRKKLLAQVGTMAKLISSFAIAGITCYFDTDSVDAEANSESLSTMV